MKTIAQRIADADAHGSKWLAKANELAESGKRAEAEKYYAKGQFWLDRSNRLVREKN